MATINDSQVMTAQRGGAEIEIIAELHGDFASILALCDPSTPKNELPGSDEPVSQLSVVAGTGS